MTQTGKNSSTETWIAKLGDILAEATGSHPIIRQVASGENEAREQMLWWRSSAVPPTYVGVSEKDAAQLLQMRRHDLQSDIPESARAGLADILERLWGPGQIEDRVPSDPAGWDVFRGEFATGSSISFFVVPPAEPVAPEGNLEMLMDIELPITLRFGSTQMALRDIAGLSAGSVIELDRGVDEPVEIMVNGHVVALGEAVMVQGAYGVRISEISSRRDKLVTSSFASQAKAIPAGERA